MGDRQAACWYAAVRVALGLGLLGVPRVMEGWVGPAARWPEAKVLTRVAGARDVALGMGTVLALRDGSSVRRWLQLAAAVDAADAVMSLCAVRHLSPRRSLPVAALAAGGAATGMWLAGRLA